MAPSTHRVCDPHCLESDSYVAANRACGNCESAGPKALNRRGARRRSAASGNTRRHTHTRSESEPGNCILCERRHVEIPRVAHTCSEFVGLAPRHGKFAESQPCLAQSPPREHSGPPRAASLHSFGSGSPRTAAGSCRTLPPQARRTLARFSAEFASGRRARRPGVRELLAISCIPWTSNTCQFSQREVYRSAPGHSPSPPRVAWPSCRIMKPRGAGSTDHKRTYWRFNRLGTQRR